MARTAQKEKVFRVAILSLRNLLNHEELGLAADMVEAGLPKIVITRQMQTWGDEDIVEMLSFLDEKLKDGIKGMSNFDLYRKEVLSGSLDSGPMHTSDLFWKENAEKFEEKDFQVLRALLKLIESSREVGERAVALLMHVGPPSVALVGRSSPQESSVNTCLCFPHRPRPSRWAAATSACSSHTIARGVTSSTT